MSYVTKRDSIVLTPLEQRYISTCYPLPDRPFLEEVKKWKKILRENSMKDEDMEVTPDEIGTAFPHINKLFQKGFFNERSIQSYFEGIDEKSHNMGMYLFARSIARRHLPEHLLLDVLVHVECCSVKVADLDSSLLWSYGMTYRHALDVDYFNLSPQNNLVLVHGKSKYGMIVIRDVLDEEFERFKSWFEARQSSNRNPFVRFRDKLETLL